MSYIIGLAGGSASGKSKFLHALKEALGEQLAVLSMDDYYKTLAEQKKDGNGIVNFDVPDAIDSERLTQDLEKLGSGQSIRIREYDFNNPNITEVKFKSIPYAPLLLIEGLFIYHFQAVQAKLDLKLFIEVEEQTRLQRRMLRDTNERGIPESMVRYQWDNHVSPAFEKWLEPYKKNCDLIINNNRSFEKALRILQGHLQEIARTWQTSSQ